MANCDQSDVRRIIDTGLAGGDIDSLIALADEEITNRDIDKNKKLISMLFTAALVSLRDDKSKAQGQFAGSQNYTTWREFAEKIIREGSTPALYVYNEPLPYED